MALQAFNLIHQKLDSEKLIKILRFGTNDYSGAFGNVKPKFNIPTIPANTLIIPKNTNLLVGGQLITTDSEVSYTYNNSDNEVLVLAVDLELDKASTKITTNIINNWKIDYLQGSSLELHYIETKDLSPQQDKIYYVLNNNNYVEVESSDLAHVYHEYVYEKATEYEEGVTYYALVDNEYVVMDPQPEEFEDGKTYYKFIDREVSVIAFESDKTYYELTKNYTINIPDGSSIKSIDYHYQTIYLDSIESFGVSKGYIIPLLGKCNDKVINLLGYKTGYELEEFLTERAIEKLTSDLDKRYTHQKGSTQEYPNGGKVGNFNFEGSKISHNDSAFITVNEDNSLNLDEYGNGALYVSGRSVESGLLPVAMGGTGATRKATARYNLGIYSGSEDPDDYFKKHQSLDVYNRDIYFKIIT